MIKYIEDKQIDWDIVKNLLEKTKTINQWSNNGPVSLDLESWIEEYLQLKNYKVVVTNSGTSALHALINMHEYISGKNLKWVVSSFSFPCCVEGPLSNATIIDCDKYGKFDINNIKDDFDGMIVHNSFGSCDEVYLKKITKFAKNNNKIVIFDSSTAIKSITGANEEFVSLHHTKPWGFGEGGFAVIPKNRENLFRSICNFGFGNYKNAINYANNYKISDLSCAFILQRLFKIEEIQQNQTKEYNRISNIARKMGIEIINNNSEIPVCVPLIFNKLIEVKGITEVKLQKYYKPLSNTIHATNLYEKIVCFPCHKDVSFLTNEQIENIINNLGKSFSC